MEDGPPGRISTLPKELSADILVRFGGPAFIGAREWLSSVQSGQECPRSGGSVRIGPDHSLMGGLVLGFARCSISILSPGAGR